MTEAFRKLFRNESLFLRSPIQSRKTIYPEPGSKKSYGSGVYERPHNNISVPRRYIVV